MTTDTTDTERQLDEFGEPIPTEEELAKERADQEAERLKTEQTVQLVREMNQTVAPLPAALPTQTAPVAIPVTPPQAPVTVVAPVAPPTQSGVFPIQDSVRPPLLTSPERIARVQQGSSSIVMPPSYPSVSPPREAQKKYPIRQMLNMGMKPKEIMATVDAARRYDAQRGYQSDLAKGMPTQDALAKWGPMLFSGSRGTMPSAAVARPMTENQVQNLDLRKQQLAQSDARTKEYQRLAQEKLNQPKSDPVLVKAISDTRAGLNRTWNGLMTTPATNPNDARFGLLHEYQTELKGLMDKYNASRPQTSTAAPSPVQAPATAATTKSTGKRVKVTGPGGKKGTIEEGDTLPEGWKLAQ